MRRHSDYDEIEHEARHDYNDHRDQLEHDAQPDPREYEDDDR